MAAFDAKPESRKTAKNEVTMMVNNLMRGAQFCDPDMYDSYKDRLYLLGELCERMGWKILGARISDWLKVPHQRRIY